MDPTSLKEPLRAALAASVRAELEATEAAWRSAVAGATDEEARPENDKDTRALELSYLARGQAARVLELRQSLDAVGAMVLEDFRGRPAAVGARVTLEDARGTVSVVFLVERGGGVTLPGGVRAVSVTSPLGAAVMGRSEGDEMEVLRGATTASYSVSEVV
jgi:transcription elongation GreA/GreB family factor